MTEASLPARMQQAPMQPVPMQPLPQITAMDRLAARPPQPLHRRGLIAAWTATVIVLLAAAAAALLWRQAVVRAWPPSSRILGTIDAVPAVPPHPAGTSLE